MNEIFISSLQISLIFILGITCSGLSLEICSKEEKQNLFSTIGCFICNVFSLALILTSLVKFIQLITSYVR